MENVKEKQQVYSGLTVSDAQQLLASKQKLCLIVGNVVIAGSFRHAGDIVPAEWVDAELLTQPISPDHPYLLRAYPLDEGLALLASARSRWDSERQPQAGEPLDLADEVKRLYPNFMRPFAI
jgi:hypothetical protein